MDHSRRLLLSGLAVATIGRAKPATSQGVPLNWIVPGSPGSVLDIGARMIAPGLSARLGRPVVIDNRVGGGGTVAAAAALRAPHDGNTVFFGNVGTFVLAPMFLPKLPYDAKRDFQPINGIGASNNILVCSTERPFRSVRDLLEYGKSGNNELTYAGGVGSMQHVAGAMFAQRADLKMTLIPYNNFTQALNDVALGRVDLIFDYPLTCIPLIRNGKLRALATNGSERLKVAPDIPTFTESGVGGVELFSWSGLYAPSDVAQTLIKNMQRALVDALHDPNLTIRMEMAGTFLWPNVGATRMRSLLDEDIARISALKIENTSQLL